MAGVALFIKPKTIHHARGLTNRDAREEMSNGGFIEMTGAHFPFSIAVQAKRQFYLSNSL